MTKESFKAALSSLEAQVAEQLNRVELVRRARFQLSAPGNFDEAKARRVEAYDAAQLKPQLDRELEQLESLMTERGELIATPLRSSDVDVDVAESTAAESPPSS